MMENILALYQPVWQSETKADRQRQHERHKYRGSARRNNRKNTRGRHTQYVQCVDTSVWPPKMNVKCIKHER